MAEGIIATLFRQTYAPVSKIAEDTNQRLIASARILDEIEEDIKS
jgi:hypothetical protein